jgi:hypothetical protein
MSGEVKSKDTCTLERRIKMRFGNEVIFVEAGETVDIIDFLLPDRVIVGRGLFRATISQDDAVPNDYEEGMAQ